MQTKQQRKSCSNNLAIIRTWKSVSNENENFRDFSDFIDWRMLRQPVILQIFPNLSHYKSPAKKKLFRSPSHLFPPTSAICLCNRSYKSRLRPSTQLQKSQKMWLLERVAAKYLLSTCDTREPCSHETWPASGRQSLLTALAQDFLEILASNLISLSYFSSSGTPGQWFFFYLSLLFWLKFCKTETFFPLL